MFALLLLLLSPLSVSGLAENERQAEYDKRGYGWPPAASEYVPDTPGWRDLMEKRFDQITEMTDSTKRYQAYHITVHAALTCPNFTEYGFGLARAPDWLTQQVQEGVRAGVEKATPEHDIEPILGPLRPKMVRRPDLTKLVLDEIQPYAEAWAGMQLKPVIAYGFRLYQNGSQLMMHTDRMMSHVVSLIYHIDSDAEPWPIYIEDYHGRTHEVILKPGDLLFYESSKCAHGRPRPLQGNWYTSVFIHYHPMWWKQQEPTWELKSHYRIPPIWSKQPAEDQERRYKELDMAGMSFKEPDCPNLWCRTQDTLKWSGPGQEGYWIAPDGKRHVLNLDVEEDGEEEDEL